MKFNSGLNSIIKDIGFWTGANTSSYTLAQRTRSVNEWYRMVNASIWSASGTWQYDDENYDTLPTGKADLVDGQQDYELPSKAQKLERVEVKDDQGNWSRILPLDKSQVDFSIEEFEEDDGMPQYYDMVGRSIMLYPAPASGDVTTTSGLYIYVSREIEIFSTGSTTKEPGFNKSFHRILSLGASLDYLSAHDGNTNRINLIRERLQEYQEKLKNFYGTRDEMSGQMKVQREIYI